jgi:hypothetical protein
MKKTVLFVEGTGYLGESPPPCVLARRRNVVLFIAQPRPHYAVVKPALLLTVHGHTRAAYLSPGEEADILYRYLTVDNDILSGDVR